jgi:hypothetical protein
MTRERWRRHDMDEHARSFDWRAEAHARDVPTELARDLVEEAPHAMVDRRDESNEDAAHRDLSLLEQRRHLTVGAPGKRTRTDVPDGHSPFRASGSARPRTTIDGKPRLAAGVAPRRGGAIFRDRANDEAPDPDHPSVHEALERRGAGTPLNEATRRAMEARFGFELHRVRVHDDSIAEQATLAVHARAFTVGEDIFFAQGAYQPDTASGAALLAHELTHVVQGWQGRLPSNAGALQVSQSGDPLEQEAESEGRDIGRAPAVYIRDAPSSPGAPGVIQRSPEEALARKRRYSSIGNLDDLALGRELARLAISGKVRAVDEVLDALDGAHRVHVSYEFAAALSGRQLTRLATNPMSRHLLDRMFEQLTEGNLETVYAYCHDNPIKQMAVGDARARLPTGRESVDSRIPEGDPLHLPDVFDSEERWLNIIPVVRLGLAIGYLVSIPILVWGKNRLAEMAAAEAAVKHQTAELHERVEDKKRENREEAWNLYNNGQITREEFLIAYATGYLPALIRPAGSIPFAAPVAGKDFEKAVIRVEGAIDLNPLADGHFPLVDAWKIGTIASIASGTLKQLVSKAKDLFGISDKTNFEKAIKALKALNLIGRRDRPFELENPLELREEFLAQAELWVPASMVDELLNAIRRDRHFDALIRERGWEWIRSRIVGT